MVTCVPNLESAPAATANTRPAIDVGEVTEHTRWDAYVGAHAEATGYHYWAWRQVFEQGLGHRCHYLGASVNGRLAGVLPLVEVTSWLFGRALSSLPYVNYGGVLADSPAVADQLVEAAAAIAAERRLEHVVLRHQRRALPALPARTHKVTMVLPLAASTASMWDGLDKKVRNQIRKAEKSGLSIRTGGEELLDDFYGVFATNMRDLGTPVYGRPLFAAILAADPGNAHLHVVYLGAQAIACSLSYGYGTTIEVPSASSLREHRALCPNHLLYWTMIQKGIADGRTRFDFGRSTLNDGTFHFKEQWGARCEQLYWEYRLIGDAALPTEDRQSTRYQKKIEAWKRLPLPVTKMLGPRIARCVP